MVDYATSWEEVGINKELADEEPLTSRHAGRNRERHLAGRALPTQREICVEHNSHNSQ